MTDRLTRLEHDLLGPKAFPATRITASTALHVGMALGNRRLVAAINDLIGSFRAKGREFASILKIDPMAMTGQGRPEVA
jgi:hypothetical protein